MKPHTMLLLLIQLCYSTFLIGQHVKHSINFYSGYAVGEPDIRYDFMFKEPPSTLLLRRFEATPSDEEYSLGLIYRYQIHPRIGIAAQVGYAALVQRFPVRVENQYFRFDKYVLVYRDVSHYHLVQLAPQVDFSLLNAGQFRGGINLLSVSNVSFRKHVKPYNLSRNRLEYFSTELYPGLFMSYGRIRLDAGLRALHFKHKDEAIANNGLEVDTYNPVKGRFSISYSIWGR